MKKKILKITVTTVAFFIIIHNSLKLNAQSATGIRSIEDKPHKYPLLRWLGCILARNGGEY